MRKLYRRIKCRLGYHDYVRVKRVSWSTLHIRCPHCRKEWGMNTDVRALLPWHEVEGWYENRDGHWQFSPPLPSPIAAGRME